MSDERSRTIKHTLLALSAVGIVLAVGRLVPGQSGRYASYLLAFTIWMTWFVETVVGLLRQQSS